MSASMNEVDDFINGALFTWVESCLPHPELLTGYNALLDGRILHSVWLQIDPEPAHHPANLDNVEEVYVLNARAKNFDCIIKNIKALFEEELGQTVLILPDCAILGHSPETRVGLDQMKLLLTLLLGAAVQCPNKQIFIGRIKELDVNTQHAIVELIKQVTDNQSLVLTNDSLEQLTPERMYQHIIRIAKERDKYHTNWINSLANESDTKVSSSPSASASYTSSTDTNHMAVELADLKSKLRKFRQELEEKSEAYIEVKEELQHKHSQYDKLRQESQEWYTESRRASAYRDEVDVLRERAERADRLDIEVQRFREKLSDSEFFKTRVEELREDNRMLLETKEMLEEQLQRSRKRSEHAMALESEIIKYKQKLNDMALERDVDKTKLQELLEENTQLLLTTQNASGVSMADAYSDEECASGDNSLSEQLTNNAQTRALKLELENRRLQQSIDSMKESSFHESANKLLDLEKDKKRLSLKVEQLQDNCGRLTMQNKELENVFKNALEENKKLQDSMDQRQQVTERQQQEREVDRMKLIDIEKHVETLTKEKQRVQNLSDSIQRRADDLERILEVQTKEVDGLRPKANKHDNLENELQHAKAKLHTIEKENSTMARDILKLRENLELKDVLLDQNGCQIAAQSKELQNMIAQVDELSVAHSKIAELEVHNNELMSQGEIDKETISTLQTDLVNGTLATKKVHTELAKIGIDNSELDTIDLNIETVVKKLVKNPETFKTVKEIMLTVGKEMTSSDMCVLCHKQEIFTVEKNFEISNCGEHDLMTQTEEVLSQVSAQWRQQCDQLAAEITELRANSEALQSENARQKVDVSTLISQITSLNTQHIALQLANSQLAAEKDVLMKNQNTIKVEHSDLLHDQRTLQCLHEQLNAEYESLSQDREILRASLRDARVENRDLKEHEHALELRVDELQTQINTMKKENENLGNLRAEHSKLKDDFRNLFSTNERLKSEYKNIQAQYKIIRTENGQLLLQNTKVTDELNTHTEQVKSLEIEFTKCTQRCELLLQMNANLDTDRRTLMDHVTQLLSQYHELLAHSLDDKQHYHDEEKLFTDKVNNLHRQKEKLEEKIMEHYKKLESCSPKKKVFGASFVKKVKKASSELINKVPSRNRRSWIDDARLTQSEIALGSESGGNDSDNSIEDHNNSSTLEQPHLLQRNAHLRQSLQRKPMDSPLSRGGIRSSFQSLKREESVRSHRNSIHSVEPPDVTGSSLTLGTAGSRRTVYLLDDKLPEQGNNNAADKNVAAGRRRTVHLLDDKLPEQGSNNAADKNVAAGTAVPLSNNTSATSTTADSTSTSAKASTSDAPSTFLMFNRISNVIGGNVVGSATGLPSSPNNGAATNSNDKNAKEKKKTPEDGKETAIWYEYGCV